ncbi:MAG: DUF4080 domain-containing protein [Clostridia bacterium]|nr:DUF4080 domain-containing protein [Clostridia bacterium]
MRVLICALNSKYIHSSLAPWYLCASVEKNVNTAKCTVYESTINVKIEKIIEEICSHNFDLIGFSTYIWNKDYVIEIAKRIKKIRNCVVVLGGPEVSYNAEEVLDKHEFVDYILSGEGEESFARLVKGEKPQEIEGLCYRENGKIIVKPPAILQASPPNPYTDEYFKNLNGRIAYIETSRGCPFRCAFCLSGRCGGVRFFDINEAKDNILKLAKSGTKTIKFIDRTFNADRKRARELFEFIIDHFREKNEGRVCFHFEIEGELIDEETLSILKKAPKGLIQFEIGIQSFNEKTLEAINRKTNLPKLVENIKKIIEMGNIDVHVDLIAGLTYESLASFEKGFNFAFSLRPNMLQLGFLKLLHGADMRENKEKYPCVHFDSTPYEVKSTSWMSEAELKKLHLLEDVFEKAYNSNRFKRTLNYIFSLLENPFLVFVDFSNYVNESKIKNTLDDFSKALFDYFSSFDVIDKGVLRDKMVIDRLSNCYMGELPEFLKIHSPIIKKVLLELDRNPETKRKKGVKRRATLLSSQSKLIYVDYCDSNKLEKTFKINEIFINLD